MHALSVAAAPRVKPNHRERPSGASQRTATRCAVMTPSSERPVNNEACDELVQGCAALDARIASFMARKPDVEGIIKLRRALSRERDVAVSLRSGLDSSRFATSRQGLENNLRGFSLELICADWAPNVTAVRKRFASRTPSVVAKLEDDEVVEVDVVAQGGALWIECKAERGRVAAGIVTQALTLQKVASAPCNLRPFGVPPRVAVFVTGELGEMEARTLRENDILILRANGVGGVAALDPLAVLPPAPAPPKMANLDVTTLFALVSEVSHATRSNFMVFLDDPVVREWAAKKAQHRACLNAELEDPQDLERQLQDYEKLVVHPSVLRRFVKILYTMGGPREQRRWVEEWSHRIEVLDVAEAHEGDDSGVESRRRRVRSLERISDPQLDAFELGEVAMAKTFTANGRAVLSAAEQGVCLETHVHRAIWLVGL